VRARLRVPFVFVFSEVMGYLDVGTPGSFRHCKASLSHG
jgi:hypothetical protein